MITLWLGVHQRYRQIELLSKRSSVQNELRCSAVVSALQIGWVPQQDAPQHLVSIISTNRAVSLKPEELHTDLNNYLPVRERATMSEHNLQQLHNFSPGQRHLGKLVGVRRPLPRHHFIYLFARRPWKIPHYIRSIKLQESWLHEAKLLFSKFSASKTRI
jgi:hypothetical protein